jgi:hypothetical protein
MWTIQALNNVSVIFVLLFVFAHHPNPHHPIPHHPNPHHTTTRPRPLALYPAHTLLLLFFQMTNV